MRPSGTRSKLCQYTYNFGVKYIGEEHAQHLLQTVQKYYTCLFEKEGEIYCGLTIKWDYVGKKVHLLMPSYVEKALKRFQHPPLIVPQKQLHQHIKKTYGAKVHLANPLDTSTPFDKVGKKFVQEVKGVFLYLARAIDSTMLTALSSLASKQTAPTERMMQKCLQFLDYTASQQEDAIFTYQASNMRLTIHSNALHLSEPMACSTDSWVSLRFSRLLMCGVVFWSVLRPRM